MKERKAEETSDLSTTDFENDHVFQKNKRQVKRKMPFHSDYDDYETDNEDDRSDIHTQTKKMLGSEAQKPTPIKINNCYLNSMFHVANNSVFVFFKNFFSLYW